MKIIYLKKKLLRDCTYISYMIHSKPFVKVIAHYTMFIYLNEFDCLTAILFSKSLRFFPTFIHNSFNTIVDIIYYIFLSNLFPIFYKKNII